MESKRYPSTFAVFDCLYYDRQDLTGRPLSESENIEHGRPWNQASAVSRTFSYNQAAALLALAQKQMLERSVAKRLDNL